MANDQPATSHVAGTSDPADVRLRQLANATPALTWIAGRDRRAVYFNDRWLAFTGRPIHEQTGDGWADLIHPDDRKRCVDVFNRAFDQRVPFTCDFRLRRADGVYRYVHDQGEPLGSGDSFEGYIGCALDITERTEAEARLREGEERLTFALEAGGMATWDNDLVTGDVVWSDRVYDMFGLPRGLRPSFEVVTGLLHPDDRASSLAAREAAMREGRAYNVEFRIIRPDGEIRWISARGHGIRNAQPRPVRTFGVLFDITDRRLVEDNLRRDSERLRMALEAGEMATWEADPATGRSIWDEREYELLGLPRSVTPSHAAFRARVHPDDVSKIDDEMKLAIEGAREFDSEFRIVRDDGSVRWISSRGRNFYDADGRLIKRIGVNQDMTERLRAAEALRSSEERLKLALDCGRMATWDADLLAGRSVWDAREYELLGVDPSDAASYQRFLAAVHPDDRQRVDRHYAQCTAEHRDFDLEFRVVHRDGSVRWIANRGRAVYDAAGRPVRRIGINFDVTEARAGAEALRQSEARLALALDSAAMGTWEWDAATQTAKCDRRWFELLGLDPVMPAARDRVTQITHPDDRLLTVDAFERALAGEGNYDVEFRVLFPDGSVHWVASKGRAIRDTEGRLLRVVGVNFDITARKQAEQAQIAAETAQRANRAKTEFLSHMSHELRTPLNAVLGFAQLIEMGVKPEMDRARAAQIVTAGRHLLAMINDVLDLSRIESGQLALSVERVDIGALLAESLALVRAMAAEAQVTLTAPALAPGSLYVRADAVRLRQVVVNLLSNAIKYNVAGGRVSVSVTRSGGSARVAVADTGRGLTATQLEHLFEPFNRLGAELSRIEGTGIGLTVSRDLIRLMNGRIDVDSEPGRGSIFSVVLPCDDAAAAAAPNIAPAAGRSRMSGNGEKRSILYVEDNEVNVLVAQHALAMLPDIDLRIARRGAEALVAVREQRPDLILVDMHLGDMLGTELKAQLDARPQTAGIPCMAVSADAMPDQVDQVRAQGFVDYVTKPFDVDDLLRRIEAVLGGRGASNRT